MCVLFGWGGLVGWLCVFCWLEREKEMVVKTTLRSFCSICLVNAKRISTSLYLHVNVICRVTNLLNLFCYSNFHELMICLVCEMKCGCVFWPAVE